MSLRGEEWDQLRKKSQTHILKPGLVIRYLNLLLGVAKEMAEKISEIIDANNEIPDFSDELYKWTLESVCLVGLDTRLGCLERNLPEDSDGMKMINAVLNQFECMIKLEVFSGHIQFWKFLPSPTWRKFVKNSDIYSEIAFKYINKAMSNLESIEANEDKPFTLLQAMLIEKKLDIRDIMVVIADFLMAGIETTAHSAGFLLYHLARNPDKQEILYQEIVKLLPIPYTELFTHERYFEEPFQFIPERWLNKKKMHPYAFMPFGFGVRSCIGRRLAEMEITLLVAEIIRKFKVEYHYEDIGIRTLLAYVPDRPLRLTFIER
ncbi:putative cytochrome P450 301a1 like protein [Argiope bruennichi]|uniref:Putative cytochrome P450 301a1 like protein n=1 Tax=Argiope bruennichi TaxID=94029 RepID=A0A8T0FY24_ARGBR|nr:putative cytochrome P450 301a1 like protein [Argiope bruennichi]